MIRRNDQKTVEVVFVVFGGPPFCVGGGGGIGGFISVSQSVGTVNQLHYRMALPQKWILCGSKRLFFLCWLCFGRYSVVGDDTTGTTTLE